MSSQLVFGAFHGAQALGEAHAQERQLLDADLELAGHAAQFEQALLGPFELVGAEIEGAGGGVDGGLGFLGLAEHPVDGGAGGGQAGDGGALLPCPGGERAAAGVLDGADRLGQAAGEAVERLGGLGDVGQGLFGGAEDGALLGQGRLLARLGIEAVEFGKAQGQLLGLGGGAGDDVGQLARAGAGGAPVGPGRGDRLGLAAQAAVGVEQGAMGARVQQADGFVLAVDLEQQVADLAQHRGAGRLVVDEGAAAAIGGEGAAQDQVLVAGVGKALLLQHVPGGMAGRQGEDRRDRRLGRAAAHEAGVRPRTDRQAQAVEDDRLACPGLAGERGQARADGQVQGLDEHDVADPKSDQHGGEDRLESAGSEDA